MLSSALSPSPLEVLATKFHLGGIHGLIIAFVIILFVPVTLLLCFASRAIHRCLRSRRRSPYDVEAQVDRDVKIHVLCTFTGTICREGCTCKYAGLPFPASPSFQSLSAAYTPALPTLTYTPVSVPVASSDEKHATFKKQLLPLPVHPDIARTMREDIEVASGTPPVVPRSKSRHYPPRVPSPLSTMPVHTADEQDVINTLLDAALVSSDPTNHDSNDAWWTKLPRVDTSAEDTPVVDSPPSPAVVLDPTSKSSSTSATDPTGAQRIPTNHLMPAAVGAIARRTPRPARTVVSRSLPPIPTKPARLTRVFGEISLHHINGNTAPNCKPVSSNKQIPPLAIRKTRPPIKRHRGTHPISAPFF